MSGGNTPNQVAAASAKRAVDHPIGRMVRPTGRAVGFRLAIPRILGRQRPSRGHPSYSVGHWQRLIVNEHIFPSPGPRFIRSHIGRLLYLQSSISIIGWIRTLYSRQRKPIAINDDLALDTTSPVSSIGASTSGLITRDPRSLSQRLRLPIRACAVEQTECGSSRRTPRRAVTVRPSCPVRRCCPLAGPRCGRSAARSTAGGRW